MSRGFPLMVYLCLSRKKKNINKKSVKCYLNVECAQDFL